MPEQREFLDRYFVDAGYHKDLIKLIAEECPVPPSVMSNHELDREILDLVPGHVAPVVKATDKQWQTLDKSLTGSMGPLTQLWTALIEARRAAPPVQVDVNKMCRLAEQTIIFLGQTHQLVTYSHRQHVLARFVRDNKKANDIIDQNTQVFQMTDDKLFGDAFYQALYRKAKGTKHLQEAKRELGFKALRGTGRKRPRLEHQPAATASAWTPAGSSTTGPQKPRDSKQPFRGGPPSGPKRGGRGSGKANRYVEAIRAHPGFTTNIRSQTDEASSWYSWSQSGSESIKLGKDYIRPMGSGDSERLPDRLGVKPSAGLGAFHPEILGNRMPQSGLGNSENAGQRCHNKLIRGTGSICRPSLPEAEKRWVTTTGIQSETPEQICSIRTFQNGGDAHGFGLGAGRVLDDKIDLKDAYFSVRIAQKDQTFLKFRWRGSLYQFRSCPFGLASAPRLFTKLLKPAMALLRRSGIQAVIYLDDIILINASQEMLRAHTETTLWLLEHLGFVVNYDKSQLEPVRQIEYLGFIIHGSHAGTTPSSEYSCNSQGIGKVVGETDIHCEGYFDKVLNHIKDMGQNELLSLKLLTMNLAMLMALTSAGRAQELHCLDPTLMHDHGHQVVFPLGKLTKALRPSKPQIELKFMQFEADPHLDVVACLRHYLQVTNPFRDSPEKRKHLFLGFSTPHNPVVTCTISRWLKELMGAAGIDTSVYKGHSVRGAATSKAKTLGLSSAQIIARANWSRVETFHKFYYKGTSDKFQNKVLFL